MFCNIYWYISFDFLRAQVRLKCSFDDFFNINHFDISFCLYDVSRKNFAFMSSFEWIRNFLSFGRNSKVKTLLPMVTENVFSSKHGDQMWWFGNENTLNTYWRTNVLGHLHKKKINNFLSFCFLNIVATTSACGICETFLSPRLL